MNYMNDTNNTNKEFRHDQLSEGQSWNGSGENALAEAEAADQTYAVSNNSRKHTAMILLTLCMLSMGGVYLFGHYQKPREATAEEKAVEAQVDTALAKLVSMEQKDKATKLFKDTEKMVQAFYDYPDSQQVPANDLQKNPFSVFVAKVDEGQKLARSRAQLEKELKKKLAQLELQTIAGTKCLINGEIFGQGQKVLDTFVVKSINVNNVVLVASDFEYVLQM